MTNQDLTEIVCILDRSGSMGGVVNDTIGAFNSFVEDQKKAPGTAQLSLVLFDNEVTPIHKSLPLADIPTLTTAVYQIRGSTALHDAVGITVQDVGNRLALIPEEKRPGRVIVMIITDGYENASKEYDGERVKAMVAHQREKYGWQFIFLGSHKDAIGQAANIGIPTGQAMFFAANATAGMGDAVSKYVSSSRSRAADAKQLNWSADARASVTGGDQDQKPVAGTIDKP